MTMNPDIALCKEILTIAQRAGMRGQEFMDVVARTLADSAKKRGWTELETKAALTFFMRDLSEALKEDD